MGIADSNNKPAIPEPVIPETAAGVLRALGVRSTHPRATEYLRMVTAFGARQYERGQASIETSTDAMEVARHLTESLNRVAYKADGVERHGGYCNECGCCPCLCDRKRELVAQALEAYADTRVQKERERCLQALRDVTPPTSARDLSLWDYMLTTAMGAIQGTPKLTGDDSTPGEG